MSDKPPGESFSSFTVEPNGNPELVPSEPKQDVLLLIHNVQKAYGEKTVLEDIDLALTEGELCTVVGPSGCGKSTLLRLILGQERPSLGEVLIDGASVGFPDPQRGIVYQQYSLYPHLSVIENVVLGPKLSSGLIERFRRKKEFRDEAMYFLDKMRLTDHYSKYPHELSGGMRQRVAIAQALIMRPRILLMDEPFGALDPGTREHLQVFLLEAWEEFDMTVFFVTHDLEEAVFLGTRIIVLSQFYQYDAETTDRPRKGAMIVADFPLPRRATSTLVKQSAEFGALIQQIRRDGFDPNYLQHVTEFDLRHPDSFHTL
ncbi:MAG: ABC transporter ATP-binding protein [Pseudomonadota bacterium]